ncbi:unnamed protein product [Calypogeia fissa]
METSIYQLRGLEIGLDCSALMGTHLQKFLRLGKELQACLRCSLVKTSLLVKFDKAHSGNNFLWSRLLRATGMMTSPTFTQRNWRVFSF